MRALVCAALLAVSPAMAIAGAGADVINYECEQLRKADELVRCKVVVGDGGNLLLLSLAKPGETKEEAERRLYLGKKMLIQFQGYGGRWLVQRTRRADGTVIERSCSIGKKAGATFCRGGWAAPAEDDSFKSHWRELGG